MKTKRHFLLSRHFKKDISKRTSQKVPLERALSVFLSERKKEWEWERERERERERKREIERERKLTIVLFRALPFLVSVSFRKITFLQILASWLLVKWKHFSWPGANFMSKKIRVKFHTAEFLWTLIISFIHFLAEHLFTLKFWGNNYSEVKQNLLPVKKGGKFQLKVLRNFTRRILL